MNKEFFRKELLDNRYGIYIKITEVYQEQIQILEMPSRFRRWLSDELDVPIDKIKIRSLSFAIQQQKKKNEAIPKNKSDITRNEVMVNNQTGTFKFSKPSSDDAKPSRIEEK